MSWWNGRDLCRRFGGRLHIDASGQSVEETFAMVKAGELLRSKRCARVWLGASDILEEGTWRDSATGEVLDIARF